MMGPRQEAQGALFYEFSIEDHVPSDHLLRSIDRFADLGDLGAVGVVLDPVRRPLRLLGLQRLQEALKPGDWGG